MHERLRVVDAGAGAAHGAVKLHLEALLEAVVAAEGGVHLADCGIEGRLAVHLGRLHGLHARPQSRVVLLHGPAHLAEHAAELALHLRRRPDALCHLSHHRRALRRKRAQEHARAARDDLRRRRRPEAAHGLCGLLRVRSVLLKVGEHRPEAALVGLEPELGAPGRRRGGIVVVAVVARGGRADAGRGIGRLHERCVERFELRLRRAPRRRRARRRCATRNQSRRTLQHGSRPRRGVKKGGLFTARRRY
mmetsp:Transcript_7596/g.26510  ORF Transcript_7596/g.26510 Transcript_7596/m.26510 type:complete len:249 (+) Transcript_7596:565-1311(+)